MQMETFKSPGDLEAMPAGATAVEPAFDDVSAKVKYGSRDGF